MGKPAARITDMHVCPMATPGTPPIPHVGGPITGPGCPTVLIGNMPAAVMGDMCVCVGPPDTIVLGSTGVMIGGKPAARMGDQCAHGGTIVAGLPTVLIGEVSGGGGGGGGDAAGGGAGGGGGMAAMPKEALTAVANDAPSAVSVAATQAMALNEAAEDGTALVHNPQTCPVCAKKAQQ